MISRYFMIQLGDVLHLRRLSCFRDSNIWSDAAEVNLKQTGAVSNRTYTYKIVLCFSSKFNGKFFLFSKVGFISIWKQYGNWYIVNLTYPYTGKVGSLSNPRSKTIKVTNENVKQTNFAALEKLWRHACLLQVHFWYNSLETLSTQYREYAM